MEILTAHPNGAMVSVPDSLIALDAALASGEIELIRDQAILAWTGGDPFGPGSVVVEFTDSGLTGMATVASTTEVQGAIAARRFYAQLFSRRSRDASHRARQRGGAPEVGVGARDELVAGSVQSCESRREAL